MPTWNERTGYGKRYRASSGILRTDYKVGDGGGYDPSDYEADSEYHQHRAASSRRCSCWSQCAFTDQYHQFDCGRGSEYAGADTEYWRQGRPRWLCGTGSKADC